MQADLRLCWLHLPHCWKSHATAQFCWPYTILCILEDIATNLESANANFIGKVLTMMNVMGKYPMTDWVIPIVTNVTTLIYPTTIVSPTQYLVINRGCLRLSVKMLSIYVSARVTLFNCGKFEHIKSFLSRRDCMS